MPSAMVPNARLQRKLLSLLSNLRCLFLLAMLNLLNIFSFSGAAYQMHFGTLMTLVSLVVLVFSISRGGAINPILGNGLGTLLVLVAICFGILAFLIGGGIIPIMNCVTLFGMPFWVGAFASIKWDETHLLENGAAIVLLSVIQIQLFMPGGSLSGWNTNSPVLLLPVLILGLSMLSMTESILGRVLMVILSLVSIVQVAELGNRDSILALFLFGILAVTRLAYKKLVVYRLAYGATIGMNVLLPLLNARINNSGVAHLAESVIKVFTDAKTNLGVNGREFIWKRVIDNVSEHPLFGLFGNRPVYSHNFSLDVLQEFGWVGWALFVAMLIVILERCYEKGSERNILPLGFACVLFANTFENVLAANDHFCCISYILLGTCLGMRSMGSKGGDKAYEKTPIIYHGHLSIGRHR